MQRLLNEGSSLTRCMYTDHTIQTSVVVLLITTIILLLLYGRFPDLLYPDDEDVVGGHHLSEQRQPSIALGDLRTSPSAPLIEDGNPGLEPGHTPWAAVLLAIAALMLRLVLLQWVVDDVGCASETIEVILSSAMR